MALPELVRQLVDTKLSSFCEARVPAQYRDEIRLDYSIRGNSVTLVERRPYFLNREEWIEHRIAQMRFDPEARSWTLYSRDRNDRWHRYPGVADEPDLDVLIEEIDEDPTCIFWG